MISRKPVRSPTPLSGRRVFKIFIPLSPCNRSRETGQSKRLLFPFKYPIKLDADIFGGISSNICRRPAFFLHKMLSFCTSVQTLHGICNSISYVVKCASFNVLSLMLFDLLLVSLAVARPQVYFTPKGVFLFSSIALSVFEPPRLARGFRRTKTGPEQIRTGFFVVILHPRPKSAFFPPGITFQKAGRGVSVFLWAGSFCQTPRRLRLSRNSPTASDKRP